jgi:hypothetical protein
MNVRDVVVEFRTDGLMEPLPPVIETFPGVRGVAWAERVVAAAKTPMARNLAMDFMREGS